MDATFLAADPATLLVVALALLDSSDRVLMQRRPENRAQGGLWEFPGGKVEPCEGPAAALVREIAEELGISIHESDVTPLTFAASQADGTTRPIVRLLYTCRNWQGEPVPEPGARRIGDAAIGRPAGGCVASLCKKPVIGLAKPGRRL